MFMRTSRNINQHELIGLQAQIISSRNPANKQISGKIVDETQHTLLIEHDGKEKRVFKKCIELEIGLGSEKVRLNGLDIEGRPWDRIKK
jgi:RNase P/RNase MRP subunit p29